MLLDSKIIYASKPEYADLRRFIAEHTPSVSAISYVEVLGYHKLTDSERHALQAFFAAAPILPLSNTVLDQAVRLRQQKKMSLGDSLVGATRECEIGEGCTGPFVAPAAAHQTAEGAIAELGSSAAFAGPGRSAVGTGHLFSSCSQHILHKHISEAAFVLPRL